MNNKSDTRTRDKIESLQPLSCGIVYGEEEAWEKLQNKLDRKPAKKMMLWGWAAAACLLLCVFMVETSPSPSKGGEVVLHNTEHKSSTSPPATPNPSREAEATTHSRVRNISAAASKPTSNELMPKASNVYSNNKEVKSDAEGIVRLDTAEKTLLTQHDAKTPSTAIHYDRKNMKVVHLNEPDKDIRQTVAPGFVAQYKLPCAVSKLPVVHINDLFSRNYEPIDWNTEPKDNNALVHLSIANPFVSYTTTDQHFSHNLFKIHLNSQN